MKVVLWLWINVSFIWKMGWLGWMGESDRERESEVGGVEWRWSEGVGDGGGCEWVNEWR